LIDSGADLAVTEVVVSELLAGARTGTVQPLRSRLLAYEVIPLRGLQDFERAALLYRDCRAAGNQLRSLTDCLIAVPAIRSRAQILHDDSDFDVIAQHSDLDIYRDQDRGTGPADS
jgi:hypothetical protein